MNIDEKLEESIENKYMKIKSNIVDYYKSEFKNSEDDDLPF